MGGPDSRSQAFENAELESVWSFQKANAAAFETANGVRWDRLKIIATAFANNLEGAESVRALPMYLLMRSRKEVEYLAELVKVYLPFADKQRWYADPAVRAEVDAEVERRLREKANREDDIRELAEYGKLAERAVMSQGMAHGMMTRLIFAVLTSTWTAFEVMAGDVWRTFLNEFPQLLTSQRMQQSCAESSGGIGSRAISIGLVSRHGFDLRNCMGDLLWERINFSDLGQLRKAYCDLFDDPELSLALESKHLRLLEEVRHLILHRSAMVDENFKRATGSPLPLGCRLPIGQLPLQEMSDAAYDCGCFILRFVDERYDRLRGQNRA